MGEKHDHPNIENSGNPRLVEITRQEIDSAGGWISFAHFMQLALYHLEHGYYLTPSARPGRSGDFLTSPEASPYFGITLARQLAECWERLGRPEKWVIREYGSGVGGLAYDVLAGLSTVAPDAFASVEYRLVEPNRYRLAEALTAMAEVGLADIVVPESTNGNDQPLGSIVGVVIANEVADAFPVHRLTIREGNLRELGVGWSDDAFEFVEADPTPEGSDAAELLRSEGIELVDGATYDVSPAAASWFADACDSIQRGFAIAIDYGYPAAELYSIHRLGGTVRGYSRHTVNDAPLQFMGEQDLTAHVDFTALRKAAERAGAQFAGFTTQGAMLASLGLGEQLVNLQRDPATTMAEYASAQAAVLRLIDPAGLGRFGVLMMAKNVDIAPPMMAFASPPPPF